jgi:hypothetical protein
VKREPPKPDDGPPLTKRTAFTYTTRRGKTYYLHTGPKRGGGIQHYVSADPAGSVAEAVPEGFEIHETPNGQVYVRKKKPARIQPTELELVEGELQKRQTTQCCYLAEVSDEKIIIHEGNTRIGTLREINMRYSASELEEYAIRNAHYVPVMRFVLQYESKRVFRPERYCFRGGVEDRISIGEPDQLGKITSKFLKHLGRDSIYELY